MKKYHNYRYISLFKGKSLVGKEFVKNQFNIIHKLNICIKRLVLNKKLFFWIVVEFEDCHVLSSWFPWKDWLLIFRHLFLFQYSEIRHPYSGLLLIICLGSKNLISIGKNRRKKIWSRIFDRRRKFVGPLNDWQFFLLEFYGPEFNFHYM